MDSSSCSCLVSETASEEPEVDPEMSRGRRHLHPGANSIKRNYNLLKYHYIVGIVGFNLREAIMLQFFSIPQAKGPGLNKI